MTSGIQTRVTAVKGRCLNHLTNGPKNIKAIRQRIHYEHEEQTLSPLIKVNLYQLG